ncbi:MAG: hypothetical protein R3A10_05655 [Caldilineaceae bacterium]
MLLEANRVAWGDYNISDEHVSDAIELLVSARTSLSEDRSACGNRSRFLGELGWWG